MINFKMYISCVSKYDTGLQEFAHYHMVKILKPVYRKTL